MVDKTPGAGKAGGGVDTKGKGRVQRLGYPVPTRPDPEAPYGSGERGWDSYSSPPRGGGLRALGPTYNISIPQGGISTTRTYALF